jgi:peptide/nickel transport system permease protein
VTIGERTAPLPLDPGFTRRTPGIGARLWRTTRRYPLAVVAGAIISTAVLVAIFAPLLAPHSPYLTDPAIGLQTPSWSHPFGLDDLGRDMFSRVLYGSRVSIEVAIMAVVFAGGIGVPIGLLSGYCGGMVDAALMRLVDAVIAFPGLVLALALVLVLGPSAVNIMLAVGISTSPVYARLVRSQVLALKSAEFVTATRSVGASDTRLLLRHIWPNTLASVIVAASLSMGSAILAEAALSFLGVGVRPPTPTWGGMLNQTFSFIYVTPWLSFFPGAAIFLLTLAFNLLGDGLRDALDPRLRRQTP